MSQADAREQVTVIDRVSSDDLMSLASESGALPMQVGAIAMLDTSAGLDPAVIVALITARSLGVPRLGQRLVSVPWGYGRPVWCDVAASDGSAQVESVCCPEPRGEESLLAYAAELVCRPLPRDRPLWKAVVVTDVEVGCAAVILVLHHVVGDGVAGLAILSALVDDEGRPSTTTENRRPGRVIPSRGQLLGDATLNRLAMLSRLPALVRRLTDALRVVHPLGMPHAARSSLNQVTGRRRRFAVVEVDLSSLTQAAHARGVTVNDLVLFAVASALHDLLLTRGEALDEVVISMPMSDRRQSTSGELGNHSGVVAIPVRTVGDPATLLRSVGAATRSAKLSPLGVSTALLGPLFRMLASVGLMHWLTNRQHLVHTFVSNLRGPTSPLTLAAHPITRLIPLSLTAGNVTVSFTALSYVGELTITLCADPDTCPDLTVLSDLLAERLSAPRGPHQPTSPDHVPAAGSSRPSTPRS